MQSAPGIAGYHPERGEIVKRVSHHLHADGDIVSGNAQRHIHHGIAAEQVPVYVSTYAIPLTGLPFTVTLWMVGSLSAGNTGS